MSVPAAHSAAIGRNSPRRRCGALQAALIVLVAFIGLAEGCGDRSEGTGGGSGEPIRASTVLGSLGDVPGKFAYPRCLEADPLRNTLWVIDKAARVQEIDPTTGACLSIWRTPEFSLGKPVGFCIAPGRGTDGEWRRDLLWVADTHYNRVLVYQPPAHDPKTPAARIEEPGALVLQFGSYGDGPGQFYLPTDVAVLTSDDGRRIERIYVSEYGGNDRISIFDADLKWVSSFGNEGTGEDPTKIEFSRPQSMVFRTTREGGKELVVADACNHRIGRFTLDGQLIGWIGSRATASTRALGSFNYPYGLWPLPDGTVLVSEFGNCRVQRVDLDAGTGVQAWGRPGRNDGELAAPWAVTTLGTNMYILDSSNNRIMGLPMPAMRF